MHIPNRNGTVELSVDIVLFELMHGAIQGYARVVHGNNLHIWMRRRRVAICG